MRNYVSEVYDVRRISISVLLSFAVVTSSRRKIALQKVEENWIRKFVNCIHEENVSDLVVEMRWNRGQKFIK